MTLIIGVGAARKLDTSKTRFGFLLRAGGLIGLFLAAHAAGQPADLLNSQRIEQTFGSYGITVLESDAALRVSSLHSTEGDDQVCRTFAVVRYPPVVDPAFAAEHAAILAGGSIGAVFAAAGWRVEKTHAHYGQVAAQGRVAALMRIPPGADLAVHDYGFTVIKNEARYRYATIAEIHHPDYLQVDDLRTIYGPLERPSDREADELVSIATAKMR